MSGMLDFLKSPKGKASLKKYFADEKARKEKREKELLKLHLQLNDSEDAFKNHIDKVVKENQDKIAYCEKHSNGYERIKSGEHKGELAEISPTKSFGLLSSYFRKYGKDIYRGEDEMFLVEKRTLNGYTIKCYQGQGCFYRLMKGKKLLLQI
jgi:hypothetical protein